MRRRHPAVVAIVLVLLADRGQAQTREPQKTVMTVAVDGRVVDLAGRPVARASVRLAGVDFSTSYTDVSDETGRFRFPQVIPGQYRIVGWANSFPAIEYGASFVGQRGRVVNIAAGQQREDVTITLRKGGAISGTVRDESGDPVGTTVYARHPLGGTFVSRTDQHGRYRLTNLTPGTYVVGMDVREFSPVTWRDSNGHETLVTIGPAYYGGGSSAAAALPVRVGTEADVTGIDLVARYVPASELTVTISTVDELTGPPQLEILADGLLRTPAANSWNRGAYRIDGLAAGRYEIVASGVVRRDSGTVERLRARAEVTVDGSAPAAINVRLEPGAQLVGRIVFDGLGLPLRVTTTLKGPNGAYATMDAASMKPDGLFSMTGIAPGEYLIDAAVTSVPSGAWSMTSVALDGQETADRLISLAANTITNVTITLSNRPVELIGRVVDGDNRPQPGLTLLVFSADQRHWQRGSRRLQMALPDAAGHYRIAGLPPGEYWLAAVSGGLEFPNGLVAGLTDLTAGALKISLSPGETKRQDLRTGKSPLP